MQPNGAEFRANAPFRPAVAVGEIAGDIPDQVHILRRAAEIKIQEGTEDVGAVLSSLRRRDQKDSSRATAPLQIALGAKIINSTGMTIEQVVDTIVVDLKKAGAVPS